MTGPDDPDWRWEFRVEDFVYARLAEAQTTAEALPPGLAQDAELLRVDSLYLIANQHNIWIDARGQSSASCITCTPAAGGVPCYTIRGLARLWSTHPDYRPGYRPRWQPPKYGICADDWPTAEEATGRPSRHSRLRVFVGGQDLEVM